MSEEINTMPKCCGTCRYWLHHGTPPAMLESGYRRCNHPESSIKLTQQHAACFGWSKVLNAPAQGTTND